MSTPPSSTLAGAAASAIALADIVGGLTVALPLPSAIALDANAACRLIRSVTAVRVRSAADVGAVGAGLVATLQSIARAAEPGDAAAALYAAADRASVAFPVSASPILIRRYALARALACSIEVAALGEAFLAESRSSYVDRRSAGEARARIARRLEAAFDRIAAALGQQVAEVLATAARETSGHLVKLASTLQPVVRVEALRSVPSTAMAWSLYGDPARAEELVLRNRCGTPLFLPPSIEAVAPKA